MPQVEVTFDIDANGILNVTARDKATGKEQKVTITASTNLNKSEIDRMVNEARAHKTEDRKRRELTEVRNVAIAWYTKPKKLYVTWARRRLPLKGRPSSRRSTCSAKR